MIGVATGVHEWPVTSSSNSTPTLHLPGYLPLYWFIMGEEAYEPWMNLLNSDPSAKIHGLHLHTRKIREIK